MHLVLGASCPNANDSGRKHLFQAWGLRQELSVDLRECFIETSPASLWVEIMPKEAWFHTLPYELIKGTKADMRHKSKVEKKSRDSS